MTAPTLTITPASSAVGALVTGIDLAAPISDASFATLRQAFHDHGVLFFRDQRLSPEQHLAFARRWAPIDINRFFKAVPGHLRLPRCAKSPSKPPTSAAIGTPTTATTACRRWVHCC